jgi:hypothetical protein
LRTSVTTSSNSAFGPETIPAGQGGSSHERRLYPDEDYSSTLKARSEKFGRSDSVAKNNPLRTSVTTSSNSAFGPKTIPTGQGGSSHERRLYPDEDYSSTSEIESKALVGRPAFQITSTTNKFMPFEPFNICPARYKQEKTNRSEDLHREEEVCKQAIRRNNDVYRDDEGFTYVFLFKIEF